jgi:hypothetical protein
MRNSCWNYTEYRWGLCLAYYLFKADLLLPIQIVKMHQLLLLHELVELQLFYSILVVWLCTGKFSRTFRIFSNLGTPYENQIEESNCCLNPLTNIKVLSNKYFWKKNAMISTSIKQHLFPLCIIHVQMAHECLTAFL